MFLVRDVFSQLSPKALISSLSRKSFKSSSPQSKDCRVSISDNLYCFILLESKCGDTLHPFVRLTHTFFFFGRNFLNVVHTLHKTSSVLTIQNRCFCNWACHSFVLLYLLPFYFRLQRYTFFCIYARKKRKIAQIGRALKNFF